ncbi:MAG TPA: response regulator [Phycisphaerae bacterium]|nr:response regulator [Phycisphaerae bacterium]
MEPSQTDILIVEDQPAHAEAVRRSLIDAGYTRVRVAASLQDYRKELAAGDPDILLMDLKLPDGNAFAVLTDSARERRFPVVVMTSHGDEEKAVQLMKNGVLDYVVKSAESLARMPRFIERALREWDHFVQHKRAEEARVLLATAIEQVVEGILITDPEGVIQYVNPAFERISGYGREEVLGQTPRLLKSGRHELAFYQRLWNTLKGGTVWSGRLTNRRKDGTLYEEEATISPIHDATGRIANFVAVKRDITQELALAERLRQSQRLEAVGQLAAGMAHDFHNWLTAILGYTHLAHRQFPTGHRALDALHGIENAAQQAAGVTRGLLTFSGKAPAQKQLLDLGRLLTETARMLRRLLPAAVEIVVDAPTKGPWVSADPTQMQQVIVNLALNARDAMPEGGVLTLVIGESPDTTNPDHPVASPMARLEVRDTGVGMTPEVLTQIFEPFFTTKARGCGTGLGLPIVHGVVRLHDGRITVDSSPGRGTTVTILLPTVPQASEAESVPATPETPRGAGDVIALAEHQPQVRGLIRAALVSAGYGVLDAGDEAALMRQVSKHHEQIQLLVIDLDLPLRQGLDCLQTIRGTCGRQPAIVICDQVGERLEDQLAEDTLLLKKPFQISELVRLAGQMLHRQFCAGDLT